MRGAGSVADPSASLRMTTLWGVWRECGRVLLEIHGLEEIRVTGNKRVSWVSFCWWVGVGEDDEMGLFMPVIQWNPNLYLICCRYG